MAHGGHDDTHGHDTHGGGHGHGDAQVTDTQGAQSTVSVYSPSEEARGRWWSMPFDATTNFSLLGFFLGWIMDRNEKNVDMRLK